MKQEIQMKQILTTNFQPNRTSLALNYSIKNSTLCKNKEFFYAKNLQHKSEILTLITEEEFKDAQMCLSNLETIYNNMNRNEKILYNKYKNIIKNYLLYCK